MVMVMMKRKEMEMKKWRGARSCRRSQIEVKDRGRQREEDRSGNAVFNDRRDAEARKRKDAGDGRQFF